MMCNNFFFPKPACATNPNGIAPDTVRGQPICLRHLRIDLRKRGGLRAELQGAAMAASALTSYRFGYCEDRKKYYMEAHSESLHPIREPWSFIKKINRNSELKDLDF